MSNRLFQILVRFVLLVLLQVLVLNNFQIMGAINPKVYVLFVFLLPPKMRKSVKLIWAFLIGLTIDIFENSGGIHASATVALAFVLPILYRIISTTGGSDLDRIKIAAIGQQKFLAFITVGVIFHHSWLFIMEAFSFRNFGWIMYETLVSSVVTIVIIFIVELLANRKSDSK